MAAFTLKEPLLFIGELHHGKEFEGADETVRLEGHPALLSFATKGSDLCSWQPNPKIWTSVGAHYREAQRAKSNADFISKIEGALQELDETGYWLELLGDSGLVKRSRLESLHKEADELISILVTIVKRVKSKQRQKPHRQTAPLTS